MKILVIGAIKGGSVPIGGAVTRGFQNLNQTTDFINFQNFQHKLDSVSKLGDPDQFKNFLLECQTRIMQKVFQFKPDVILGIAQSPLLDTKFLAKLKKMSIKLIFWFVEDFHIFTYWKSIAGFFDYFFILQKEPFFGALQQMGLNNYYYLPMAFDPDTADVVKTREPEFDISFVGAPYPNRVFFFNKLNFLDFSIFGEGWERYPSGSVKIGDRRIGPTQVMKIYTSTKININLHSALDPESFGCGDFINPRTFELAGLGAFQLVDNRTLLGLHFKPNEEIVVLSSFNEMKLAINYYLANPGERVLFARKARERAMDEHTFGHRCKEILRLL